MSVPQLRKYLSAPGLLARVRRCFEQIPDPRRRLGQYRLSDVLMSGLAMFGLKYPSLLKFDEGRDEAVVRHNLRQLYGIERAPSDTQMREVLDRVDPQELRGAFAAVHQRLRRDKVMGAYEVLGGYYPLLIDGSGHFASGAVRCPQCCIKKTRGGERYYHQILAAVIAHPQRSQVLPVLAEPIVRGDGTNKNDCERTAAKRLLRAIRADHPTVPWVVVEDGLSSNGPHIELLQELDYRFILGAKPGDHPALFQAVDQALRAGQLTEIEWVDERGIEHGCRFLNDVSLNRTHAHLRVNYLDYWQIKDTQQTNFTWVTDIPLSQTNVREVIATGRCRWKIENETFNTLKNQGYDLEHNYGHGQQSLASVLALLMLLAFLIDQVQEWLCPLFQGARARYRSRTSLWHKLRALFDDYYIPSWEVLWRAIAQRHVGAVLQPDTS